MKKLLILALALGSLAWLQVYPPSDGSGGQDERERTGTTALTSGVDTEFVTLAIDQDTVAGGWVEGTVECADASNLTLLQWVSVFACYNDAGTESCTIVDDSDFAQAGSAGSSTVGTMDYVTGTDEVTFRWNGTCSLTETTLDLHWYVRQNPSRGVELSLP